MRHFPLFLQCIRPKRSLFRMVVPQDLRPCFSSRELKKKQNARSWADAAGKANAVEVFGLN